MTVEEYSEGLKRYFSTRGIKRNNGNEYSTDNCHRYQNASCYTCIFHNNCINTTFVEKAAILEKWLKEHPVITNRQHFIDEFGFDGYTCNRTCSRTFNSNNDCDICSRGRYAEYKKPEAKK